MKALTVRQPWASLIVHGVKWIETRSQRTNIRGRIGIVAGMHRPDHGFVGQFAVSPAALQDCRGGDKRNVPMPMGALIGTVELYDCVPIVPEANGVPESPCIEVFEGVRDVACAHFCDEGMRWTICTDQLPYGDFQRGRWAWLLRDPQPCTPVPMRGFQGWREVEL